MIDGRPNAVTAAEGRNAVTRAIGRIDAFTDVRVSYGGYELLASPASIRRDVLKKKWYFHCECDECTFANPGSQEREAIRYFH